jgi:hypothetical protein
MTALRNRYKTTTAAIISFSRFIFLRMLMSVGTAKAKPTHYLVNDRCGVNKTKEGLVLKFSARNCWTNVPFHPGFFSMTRDDTYGAWKGGRISGILRYHAERDQREE